MQILLFCLQNVEKRNLEHIRSFCDALCIRLQREREYEWLSLMLVYGSESIEKHTQ